MIAEGDKVVVRAARHAIHRGAFMGVAPTGRHVAISTMYILRVANGQITDAWLNWDQTSEVCQTSVV